MKIHLATSGGIGNLRIAGRIDTSELSEELAEKVESAFSAERLTAAEEAESSPFMMDAQQYELTVLPEGPEGEARQYRLDDSALGDEMLDVLDVLRGEIVRRMAAEK